MDLNTVTTIVQVSIITLVAALLHELTRVMSLCFLSYWSRGWVALAVGLCALVGSFHLTAVHGVGHPGSVALMMLYCVSEYMFGYSLWLGCRNYHSGRNFDRRDLRVLALFGALGIVMPIIFPHIDRLFPVHAAIMGCFFAISTIECRVPTTEARLVGVRVLRLSLVSLTILFAHYAFFIGWFSHHYPNLQFIYMNYSSLYDATLEVGMAFGMVLLATERVRLELEAKNARLGEATIALEKTAHTDPLTGLLNRLAFEEIRTNPAPIGPFGTLAIIDLNDLKPLNDIYGHRIGDVALQLVARSLRIHSRVTDPIFRLGGDEFAIVMPECPVADLTDRLGQIDDALTSQRLPGIDTPQDIRIAWGCVGYGSPAEFFSALSQADDRMYEQKKARKGDVRSRGEILV